TFGLLVTELFIASGSRCLTLTFASLNALGLVLLVLTHRRFNES
ncbi:unnamed protein product, partial [marine sediment metagenome]